MSYKIAIVNEKGGVAKTTTAVSTAAVLADKGYQVLQLDLDPQSNLSLANGIEMTKGMRSAASILVEGLPIAQAVFPTPTDHLFIIPGSGEMALAERFLPGRNSYEYILKHALDALPPDYEFIVMDCPPFLGAVTLNALVAADLLLIPTQAEFFSIYALRNLMNLVRRVRAQYNSGLTYRLLLTMFDRRNRIHRTMADQLRSSFTTGVMQTVIDTDTKLRESPVAGTPIIYHAPKSRSAQQYRALGQEIVDYVKETTYQPA